VNGGTRMTPDSEWSGRRGAVPYDGLVRIVMTPKWAKLIDFENDPAERGRGTGPTGVRSATRLSAGGRDQDGSRVHCRSLGEGGAGARL